MRSPGGSWKNLWSRSIANFNQPFLPHLDDEIEQILGAWSFGHVVLFKQPVQNFPERLLLMNQMPNPCSYRVEAEIDTGIEIEDHLFSLEVVGKDPLGNSEARCQ